VAPSTKKVLLDIREREPGIHSLAFRGPLSACFLAQGIIDRNWALIGLAAFNVAVILAYLWWRGPKERHRARDELGDESRQLRDGLVRRMRERRVTAPSPSPSR
jgi:membrane protein implicated in regulation of membrane protease activity